MAANGKTYKLEQETQDKLQAITDEMGLTWDATFSMLADLYAQQKATEALPGRKTEITEVQSLLNRLSGAFTHAWEINADTDERIKMEYSQRMATQEEAIAALKTKAEDADAEAKQARDKLAAASKNLAAAKKQVSDLQSMLDKTKAAADAAAEASAKAIADKDKLNDYMQQQLSSLTNKAAASDELEKKVTSLQEELATNSDKIKQLTSDLSRANETINALKEKMTELKGRYDERMDVAAQKASNELHEAVLKEREAAAAKLDELREKYASRLLELTKPANSSDSL
jgi:DNA repair exonuclease SbcCD ATPase subunit